MSETKVNKKDKQTKTKTKSINRNKNNSNKNTATCPCQDKQTNEQNKMVLQFNAAPTNQLFQWSELRYKTCTLPLITKRKLTVNSLVDVQGNCMQIT